MLYSQSFGFAASPSARLVVSRLVSLKSVVAGFAKESDAQKGGERPVSDTRFQQMLQALAPMDFDPRELELSEEDKLEYSKRAKEYSRHKWAEHRAWQRDLSTKLKLKKAALAALPPELQEEACKEDLTPFPADRLVFTATPPIPGFEEQQRTRARSTVGSDRKRGST